MTIPVPGDKGKPSSSGAIAAVPTLLQSSGQGRALAGWASLQRVIDRELPAELATVEHLNQLTGRILSGL